MNKDPVTGDLNDDTPDCPECDGKGWVYDPSDGGTMTCPVCDGTGKEDD